MSRRLAVAVLTVAAIALIFVDGPGDAIRETPLANGTSRHGFLFLSVAAADRRGMIAGLRGCDYD
jgi:hypothetical protein